MIYKMKESRNFLHTTSRLLYLLIALVIAAISLLLISYGIREVWDVIHGTSRDIIDKLLDAIGVIVISLALFDVTKYLIEEEVVENRPIHKTKEDLRQTLIKFLSIIAIAEGAFSTRIWSFLHSASRFPPSSFRLNLRLSRALANKFD